VGWNATRGTYSFHAPWMPSGCRVRPGGGGGRFRQMGNLVEVCHRNLDHHVYLLPFVIEVDGELSAFVEASLQRFRRLSELEVQLRQGVEEGEAVLAWPVGFGFVRHLKILDLPEGSPTLCVELVVAPAQPPGERVVGVAVLRLAKQVALPAIKLVDLLLESASLGYSFPGGPVVVGREFGGQEGDPVASAGSSGPRGATGEDHHVAP